MFGSVGGAELVLVLVLALLLFGPRKLPQIGRTLGNAMAEFRRSTTEFRMNLEREVDMDQVRDVGREFNRTTQEIRGIARDATAPASGAKARERLEPVGDTRDASDADNPVKDDESPRQP